MSTLRQALSWLADGSHWTGTGGILQRLAEHLQMFALVMLIAAAIALPLGLIIGHARKGAFLAVNAAGIGRATLNRLRRNRGSLLALLRVGFT